MLLFSFFCYDDDMTWIIKNKDCLEYIKKLKEENLNIELFDAVITDPPYNISKKNNFQSIGRSGIDFGKWDYEFDQTKWIKKISPFIKNGGSIIIFNDYKNFGEISKELEEQGFFIKDLLRWVKNNPMPRNVERRYVTDFEFAIWAVKGNKKWTFNKQKSKKYLRPEFKNSIVSKSIDKLHPTQKPVELMEKIINIHTNKNDWIFDPFMGSGSTCVAALKLQRNFVGCEIDKKYFCAAKQRIERYELEMNKINRSPLYYLGDKYKLLPQLKKLFPNNIRNFYDAFAGGGTVIANVIAQKYFYNDKQKEVCNIVKLLSNTNPIKILNDIYIYIYIRSMAQLIN
ncbi:DNA methyltransferase [Metamycoplasma hominis]|uniref:DNA-methyltransferase n=2 Tax=Metamycoplasma hominis TaxID=2098 RepID=UPI003D9FDA3B